MTPKRETCCSHSRAVLLAPRTPHFAALHLEVSLDLIGREVAVERTLEVVVGLLLNVGGVLETLDELVLLLLQVGDLLLDLHANAVLVENAVYEFIALLLPLLG